MSSKECDMQELQQKGPLSQMLQFKHNVGIVDDDSEITAEEERDFIISVSEPKYSVLNQSSSVVKTNQGHKLEYAVKKQEIIKSATGKTRCIQFTLRVNKTLFLGYHRNR